MWVRKKNVLIVIAVLLFTLLAVTPVMALPEPNGEVVDPVSVCRNDGTVKVTYTNYYDAGGAYFMACTDEAEPTCKEMGWLSWGKKGSVVLPKVGSCVSIHAGYCQTVLATLETLLLNDNGCIPNYGEPIIGLCTRDEWPACPVDKAGSCEGGAGLYPPSNSGVPYNGYNDAGYFILVVDNHCKQYVDLVDVFTGDPLTEVMQVMTLPVDPNGWAQFSEDDIQYIRDTYDYAGEIWFRVHGIGDRYYGLQELMTHPNLGSAD